MASRWVLWLTQKDTLTGGQREFVCVQRKMVSCHCLEGVRRCWLVSSKPTFLCPALDTTNYVFPLSAGFLLAFSVQDTGEGLTGREKGLFCLCHSGNSPSFRHLLWVPASALGDTPEHRPHSTPSSEFFLQLQKPLLSLQV